jgi:tetratricopeptide (TPR) repeat protein
VSLILLWGLLGLGLAGEGAVVTPAAEGLSLDADGEALLKQAAEAFAAGRLIEAAGLYDALADGGAGPQARVLQAVALYEAGELRLAAEALDGVSGDTATGLLGLILVESGAQAEGMKRLEQARRSADPAVAARAGLNLALAQMDRGQLKAAESGVTAARAYVSQSGDTTLEGPVRDAEAALAQLKGQAPPSGASALTALSDALARGDLSRAKGQVDSLKAQKSTRRDRVEGALAQGAYLRAVGQPEAAAQVLTGALAEAREGGMGVATAQALVGLAIAHSLAGRVDLAVTLMAEAEETAAAAGLLTLAADASVELGLLLVRQGQGDAAAQQATRAKARLEGLQHPSGVARLAELDGALAADRGDTATAAARYGDAVRSFVAQGHHADAARAAVGRAAALTVAGGSPAQSARAEALEHFRRAGDPLGPAHLELACALAYARAGRLDDALGGFAKAAELGRGVASPQGQALAKTAENNAARALVALGASQAAAEQAAAAGLSGAVGHQRALDDAFAAYDAGLAAYAEGRFSTARAQFSQAYTALKAAGEATYATQARLALAWTAYNIAVGLPPQEALPFWGEVIAEAGALEDEELLARATAAQALCADRLGLDPSGDRLRHAAGLAERTGLPAVAARCWAALAEGGRPIDDRARAARRAYALDPGDQLAVYAMYSVAVDAYNDDKLELARALCVEVLPRAGSLDAAVRGVIVAIDGG